MGIFRASIYLDVKTLNLGNVSSVKIFGEFSERSAAGAWGQKIECKPIASSTGLSQVFMVTLDIKQGQKFKFIIDDGRAYTVSSHYLQSKDASGNVNNIY